MAVANSWIGPVLAGPIIELVIFSRFSFLKRTGTLLVHLIMFSNTILELEEVIFGWLLQNIGALQWWKDPHRSIAC